MRRSPPQTKNLSHWYDLDSERRLCRPHFLSFHPFLRFSLSLNVRVCLCFYVSFCWCPARRRECRSIFTFYVLQQCVTASTPGVMSSVSSSLLRSTMEAIIPDSVRLWLHLELSCILVSRCRQVEPLASSASRMTTALPICRTPTHIDSPLPNVQDSAQWSPIDFCWTKTVNMSRTRSALTKG